MRREKPPAIIPEKYSRLGARRKNDFQYGDGGGSFYCVSVAIGGCHKFCNSPACAFGNIRAYLRFGFLRRLSRFLQSKNVPLGDKRASRIFIYAGLYPGRRGALRRSALGWYISGLQPD